ncbi:hypothetical protein SCHPADRAFT_832679 [Schizopora paradoxa]|uniref:Glycosyltransferase family 49 protein n=1 Tax=Schizopora paradoxa TaxID=27342 RepID=A0A0H2RLI0_9AGAM|nr:hypothetical protein SCHPADRAFT_832679 [Schizopora paradoxa]
MTDDAKSRLFFSKTFGEKIYWDRLEPEGSYLLSGFTRERDPPSTDAGIFFSKAFATSQEHLSFNDQNNMQVIPYYYRASLEHDSEDITITTLVTRDRFLVFKQLVERYKGPISATIHVSKKELNTDSGSGFVSILHQLYSSSPFMALNVDIHLVVTPTVSDRQFNTWRNIARMFARTDYVMMLDVDFVPCTNFKERLKIAAGDEIKNLVRSGEAALVVPAFEFTKHEDGLDASTFPADKKALAELYNASRITMFHNSWAPGHNSSDYPRFLFSSRPGEIYKIKTYQHSYEPYVIFRRDGPGSGIPWCDERFVGYGGNKAACLFEMYLSGVSFYVLSDDFLVHQSHIYDEMARKLERRYNRKIYADFREETCLKYLKAFFDRGTLESPRAANAREECKKVRGVSRFITQVCANCSGFLAWR